MKRLLSLILLFAMAFALAAPAMAATEEAVGTTLRLSETKGTVTVKDASGKNKSVRASMRLYNSYTVKTGAESSAYIQLDDAKAVQLDANTTVKIQKSGKKLEVALQGEGGQIFFNVTSKLKKDESFTIRNANTVTGVRGTSGIITDKLVAILEGKVQVTILDDGSGSVDTQQALAQVAVAAGQMLNIIEAKEAAIAAATGEGATSEEIAAALEAQPLTADDIPAQVVEAMMMSPTLAEAVQEAIPTLDVQALYESLPEKQAAEAAAQQQAQVQADANAQAQKTQIESLNKADGTNGVVSDEKVFSEIAAATPAETKPAAAETKPAENRSDDSDSGSSGGGSGNGSSTPASGPVNLKLVFTNSLNVANALKVESVYQGNQRIDPSNGVYTLTTGSGFSVIFKKTASGYALWPTGEATVTLLKTGAAAGTTTTARWNVTVTQPDWLRVNFGSIGSAGDYTLTVTGDYLCRAVDNVSAAQTALNGSEEKIALASTTAVSLSGASAALTVPQGKGLLITRETTLKVQNGAVLRALGNITNFGTLRNETGGTIRVGKCDPNSNSIDGAFKNSGTLDGFVLCEKGSVDLGGDENTVWAQLIPNGGVWGSGANATTGSVNFPVAKGTTFANVKTTITAIENQLGTLSKPDLERVPGWYKYGEGGVAWSNTETITDTSSTAVMYAQWRRPTTTVHISVPAGMTATAVKQGGTTLSTTATGAYTVNADVELNTSFTVSCVLASGWWLPADATVTADMMLTAGPVAATRSADGSTYSATFTCTTAPSDGYSLEFSSDYYMVSDASALSTALSSYDKVVFTGTGTVTNLSVNKGGAYGNNEGKKLLVAPNAALKSTGLLAAGQGGNGTIINYGKLECTGGPTAVNVESSGTLENYGTMVCGKTVYVIGTLHNKTGGKLTCIHALNNKSSTNGPTGTIVNDGTIFAAVDVPAGITGSGAVYTNDGTNVSSTGQYKYFSEYTGNDSGLVLVYAQETVYNTTERTITGFRIDGTAISKWTYTVDHSITDGQTGWYCFVDSTGGTIHMAAVSIGNQSTWDNHGVTAIKNNTNIDSKTVASGVKYYKVSFNGSTSSYSLQAYSASQLPSAGVPVAATDTITYLTDRTGEVTHVVIAPKHYTVSGNPGGVPWISSVVGYGPDGSVIETGNNVIKVPAGTKIRVKITLNSSSSYVVGPDTVFMATSSGYTQTATVTSIESGGQACEAVFTVSGDLILSVRDDYTDAQGTHHTLYCVANENADLDALLANSANAWVAITTNRSVDALTMAGHVLITTSGELTVTGQLINNGTITNQGSLTNNGTIKGSGVLKNVNGTIVNNGTISVTTEGWTP